MTIIYVSKLTIIGSDNDLSPGWCQAIIWANHGILLIQTSGTSISEILIKIHTFPLKKIHLKMLSVKFRPFCVSLNVFKCQENWDLISHLGWTMGNQKSGAQCKNMVPTGSDESKLRTFQGPFQDQISHYKDFYGEFRNANIPNTPHICGNFLLFSFWDITSDLIGYLFYILKEMCILV